MSNARETYLENIAKAKQSAQAALVKSSSPSAVGIAQVLEGMKAQIAKALPKHLTAERMIRVATTVLQRNPKVAACKPETIIGSILTASQLGLEPDGVLGQAYLVPYKDQCTLQVGYRGLMSLAYRSGVVKGITAEVVYEADYFEFEYGLDPKLVHKPSADPQRGAAKWVYCVVQLADGGRIFRVLTMADIERIKRSSQTRSKDTPWNTHPEEMMRKTAVRNVLKYCPQAIEAQAAAVHDEYAEAGVVETVADVQVEVLDAMKATGAEPEAEREPGQEG